MLIDKDFVQAYVKNDQREILLQGNLYKVNAIIRIKEYACRFSDGSGAKSALTLKKEAEIIEADFYDSENNKLEQIKGNFLLNQLKVEYINQLNEEIESEEKATIEKSNKAFIHFATRYLPFIVIGVFVFVNLTIQFIFKLIK